MNGRKTYTGLFTALRGIVALAVLTLLGQPAFAQEACGTTTWDLTAGQTIDVGSVTVSNDLNNVYVTYTSIIPAPHLEPCTCGSATAC
jgi:hypothetical protein